MVRYRAGVQQGPSSLLRAQHPWEAPTGSDLCLWKDKVRQDGPKMCLVGGEAKNNVAGLGRKGRGLLARLGRNPAAALLGFLPAQGEVNPFLSYAGIPQRQLLASCQHLRSLASGLLCYRGEGPEGVHHSLRVRVV